jgi:hypothetical protein
LQADIAFAKGKQITGRRRKMTNRDIQEFKKEANWLKELYKSRQLDGQLKCVRCWEYDWLSPNGLCGRCIGLLRVNFPEMFEQARQENIKLFDEGRKLYYENGIKG